MDWLYVLMPVAGIKIFWPGLVILGIGAGIFGMGGTWMVTPGLNILGFPMAFAIGTNLAHLAGQSIISTVRHGKFHNVDYPLSLTILAGTVIGLETGAQTVMWLERIGLADLVVRCLYLVFMAGIAFIVISDVTKKRRKEKETEVSGKGFDQPSAGPGWHQTLLRIKIPPMMYYKVAQIQVSFWLPFLVGCFTGWAAGILGIGGGLFRMPALVYFIGCPAHIAVGTDLFEVSLSGLYGAGTYAMKGRTEWLAMAVLLGGWVVGDQIGTAAAKYIKGYGIRIAFGLCVVGCFCSIVLTVLAQAILAYATLFNGVATVLILGLLAGSILYIMVQMLRGRTQRLTDLSETDIFKE